MQKYMLFFVFFLALTACENDDVYVDQISELREELAETEQELADAQMALAKDGGLVHTVFFWMKDDLTEEQTTEFEEGLQSLEEIESVRRFYWGKPGETEARGVVDRSYDYALIIHFEDLAGHDVYQPHEIHQNFVEGSSDKWTKVVVYDANVEGGIKEIAGTLPSPDPQIGGMDRDDTD
ncbi:MAG: Dabb family protein [Bacteroidota bacterium]